MMMTLLKKKGGQGNHKRKLNDFVMIEKIVLIGLIQGKGQEMEEVIEMVEKAIGVTLIEREELIQIGMWGQIMNIGIGGKIAMDHTLVTEDVTDKKQIIDINIEEIVVETNMMKKIIGMEETKVNYNKSVNFKIIVQIIYVIVCQILVTMDIKIALVIVQYQLNKRILDIV
jgi:hypothetical protein